MSTPEEKYNAEAEFRLRRLLCAIYAWGGITEAQAIAIGDDFLPGDTTIRIMCGEGLLMEKTIPSTNLSTYEYTFAGLTHFYALAFKDLQFQNPSPSEDELINYTRKYAAEIAGRVPNV